MGFTRVASAETRTLKLYYINTKEKASITFKKDGRYLAGGLNEVNRFLRDWRRNEPTKMDPKLLDLVWEAYKMAGGRDYIHVVSAYRSPATNAMLRKTRGGQATKSQHMLGKAMDFYIPGVPIKKLREIGFKLGGGGVGYYPRSGVPFVHLDTGSVRAWPRMSRDELVRLFPQGGTAHLPATGAPLPGYEQALARAQSGKRGSTVIVDDTKKRSGGLLATLFGGRDEEEDDAEVEVAEVPRAKITPSPAPAPAPAEPAVAPSAIEAGRAPAPPTTPGNLLAALPSNQLPIPNAAPRARANNQAVPVTVATAPATAVEAVPTPVAAPVEVAFAPPAPKLPIFVPPIPAQRPAVLIARAEAPIDRRSAQELEEALRAADKNAGQIIDVAAAAPSADNGDDAIKAAINGVDAKPATTELAYALPIPSPAPRNRSGTQIAALPTPTPIRPTEPETAAPLEVAYAPPSADIVSAPATISARPAKNASGKSGRVVSSNTDETQTAALDNSVRTTTKYARPTTQDISAAENPKPAIVPAAQIDQSRFGSWTTANTSVATDGRAEAQPDFIQNATRAIPTVVYTAGFSKAPPPNTTGFSGNAVTFLAVAKFDNGVGDGGEGNGEPLQLSVPN
ncbi:MAG: DUF882 domain-containing protein [Ahrensia sp.]|nr:DUF882 domain-containing protein [Ahrensia sp.]